MQVAAVGGGVPFVPKPEPKRGFLNLFGLRKGDSARLELEKNPKLEAVTKAFCSTEFFVLRGTLEQVVKSYKREDLGKLFDALIAVQDFVGLKRCLSFFSPDDIQKLLGDEISRPEEMQKAFAIAHEEYVQLVASTEESILKHHGNTFVRMVRNFIDGILLSLDVGGLTREVTSRWEADQRLGSYVKIGTFPLLLFTALATVCLPLTALIVTGALCVSAVGSAAAYIKWLQASPSSVEYSVNMVEEAKIGTLGPVFARECEIDGVLNALASSSDGHRAHPLLVGPTGVGKTEIIKGIAQRLVSGDVPKCLQGKKLLSVNTAELLQRTNMGQDALLTILYKIAEKRNDYIVFFDEVHNAMLKKELGERLKTVLDTNPHALPYVIGATTAKEYDEHVAPDLAFSRRFQRMDVAPTNKEQTVLILREMVKREAPELTVTESVLEYIYEKSSQESPDLFQPAIGKNLLAKAIAKAQQYKAPDMQKNVQELSNLSSRIHALPEALADPQELDKILALKEEVERQKAKEKELAQAASIQKEKIRFCRKQVSYMFQAAHKAYKKGSTVDKVHFLFWNYYLLPRIKVEGQVIDRALIEELTKSS